MRSDPSTPILLVADQAKAVIALADVLETDLGFKAVDIAASGAAALEMLRAVGPMLVIADLHMKPMSGLDFLRAIRADDNLKDIPVILTAHRLKGPEATAVKLAGANGLILQPFAPAALLAKIDAAVSPKPNPHAPQTAPAISLSLLLARRSERRWA